VNDVADSERGDHVVQQRSSTTETDYSDRAAVEHRLAGIAVDQSLAGESLRCISACRDW
jgi:hypothetical protein